MRVCYGVCMCRGVHNCAYNIHIIYCAGVCVVVRSVHVCMLGCVYMGCVCVCVCRHVYYTGDSSRRWIWDDCFCLYYFFLADTCFNSYYHIK